MWSINKGKIGLQKIIYDCMTKDAQKSSHLRIGVAENNSRESLSVFCSGIHGIVKGGDHNENQCHHGWLGVDSRRAGILYAGRICLM